MKTRLHKPDMLGKLRLFGVLGLAALLIIILLPVQLFALLVWPWLARTIPVYFHRLLLYLFGVQMHLSGSPAKARPLLIVSNHVSWLDIVVLSAVLPVSFVAKAEMRSWPLFGQLAMLQRTIFVKRQERRQSGEQANEIAERLMRKDAIALFPEGTTSDGHGLYAFKTPLFEAARFALVANEQRHAFVQPVAIDYSHLHGIPIGRQWRQHVAWPGDVGLKDHFLPLVEKGALDVTLHFGEPILFTPGSKRKQVAAQAKESIEAMLIRDR